LSHNKDVVTLDTLRTAGSRWAGSRSRGFTWDKGPCRDREVSPLVRAGACPSRGDAAV